MIERSSGVLRHRVDVDDRDRQVADRRPRVAAPAGDDDAVDAAAEQRAHVVLLAQRVVAPVAQQRRHLARAERVLDAEHDREREAAEGVGGQDADGVGAALEEAAGERVGLEAELLGRREHALARRVRAAGRGRSSPSRPCRPTRRRAPRRLPRSEPIVVARYGTAPSTTSVARAETSRVHLLDRSERRR